MAQQSTNISIKLDVAKVITAIVATGSFIFYAGKLDQKVEDLKERVYRVESKLDGCKGISGSYPVYPKQEVIAINVDMCLLNNEEKQEL